jgi:hypothetical protein
MDVDSAIEFTCFLFCIEAFTQGVYGFQEVCGADEVLEDVLSA